MSLASTDREPSAATRRDGGGGGGQQTAKRKTGAERESHVRAIEAGEPARDPDTSSTSHVRPTTDCRGKAGIRSGLTISNDACLPAEDGLLVVGEFPSPASAAADLLGGVGAAVRVRLRRVAGRARVPACLTPVRAREDPVRVGSSLASVLLVLSPVGALDCEKKEAESHGQRTDLDASTKLSRTDTYKCRRRRSGVGKGLLGAEACLPGRRTRRGRPRRRRRRTRG